MVIVIVVAVVNKGQQWHIKVKEKTKTIKLIFEVLRFKKIIFLIK